MSAWDDLTGRHSVAVVGGPTVINDQSLWGGGSTYFDGSFAYLRADGHPEDWAFGAGDFCIEFAAKAAAGSYSSFGFISLSGRAFQGYNIGTPSGYVGGWWNSSSDFLPQVWQTVAIDRKDGLVRLFIAGQKVSENTFPYELADASPLLIGILGQGDTYYRFKGHMGYVRITRASRYGSDYTPQALVSGPADPLWGQTVFFMRGAEAAPIGIHDDLLRRLLPPVSIDPNGGAIAAELKVYGSHLDAVGASAEALLSEADPRVTVALLADWERDFGLEAGSQSEAVRQVRLLAQILAGGGQSRSFYIQIAAALGYTATVTEFKPHTVSSSVDFPLFDMVWRFGWRITSHPTVSAIGQAAFEALIRRLSPAHTFIQFAYI